MTRELHVRTPLFDRLAGSERTLDARGLRDSLRRELGLLFNTRSTFPAQHLEGAPLTVIDYGIPSLTDFCSNSQHDQVELAAALRLAIETFEPRLTAVRVYALPPAENQLFLTFAIQAEQIIDAVREPVSFVLDVDPQTELVDIDAGD